MKDARVLRSGPWLSNGVNEGKAPRSVLRCVAGRVTGVRVAEPVMDPAAIVLA